ncbi:MAG: hypothetical protein HY584_01955 [Candidatus Omnitrophica bacterium]|nr:hypothetical protein [Candidatus Omnitrophota bacterium]
MEHDPFEDPVGPYYHQIYKAISSDGLEFTKIPELVFDKASVPDVLRLADGRILIYAVDGAHRSRSGLMVAISSDNARSWQQGSLQMRNSRGFAGADPEAVLLADGKIRLYYVTFGKRPEPGQPPDFESVNDIRSAVSSDGILFEEEDGIRFSYPQITDPDMIKIQSTWFMYVSQGPRLIRASSPDGLHFEYEDIVRENGSVSNTVAVEGGRWRQYYCAEGIRSALTSDGLHWQEEGGFRAFPEEGHMICDPAPVKVESHWMMFYKVAPLPRHQRRW